MHTQQLSDIQAAINATAQWLNELQSARTALLTGDTIGIDMFATLAVGSRVLADEPVYIPVNEYEEAALRDAFYWEMETIASQQHSREYAEVY